MKSLIDKYVNWRNAGIVSYVIGAGASAFAGGWDSKNPFLYNFSVSKRQGHLSCEESYLNAITDSSKSRLYQIAKEKFGEPVNEEKLDLLRDACERSYGAWREHQESLNEQDLSKN